MFKKSRILALVLGFTLVFSTTAFAAMTESRQEKIAGAREYLMNYNKEEVDEFGKAFTTEYNFKTSQDLDAAATYIADHGLEAFNEAVENAIREAVSQEPKSAMTRTTDPATVYRTVSGDGNHDVRAEAYGLARFNTLGTVEYRVELGYRVNVQNGRFTQVTSTRFDIPYISAAGSWGDLRMPSHCTSTNAGVTANYTITKSVQISVGDFGFEIKSETDNEIFSLLTNLR